MKRTLLSEQVTTSKDLRISMNTRNILLVGVMTVMSALLVSCGRVNNEGAVVATNPRIHESIELSVPGSTTVASTDVASDEERPSVAAACEQTEDVMYSYYIAQSLEDLVERAETVVVARVLRVHDAIPVGRPHTEATEARTRVEYVVEATVRGTEVAAHQTIVRSVTGGVVDGRSLCVPEEPMPVEGQRVLMFVRQIDGIDPPVTHQLVAVPGEFLVDAGGLVQSAIADSQVDSTGAFAVARTVVGKPLVAVIEEISAVDKAPSTSIDKDDTAPTTAPSTD